MEKNDAENHALCFRMRRMSRGILGVKKDPKHQMLFSFGVRKGEEWPSDSDDSDYAPLEKEAPDRDRFIYLYLVSFIYDEIFKINLFFKIHFLEGLPCSKITVASIKFKKTNVCPNHINAEKSCK